MVINYPTTIKVKKPETGLEPFHSFGVIKMPDTITLTSPGENAQPAGVPYRNGYYKVPDAEIVDTKPKAPADNFDSGNTGGDFAYNIGSVAAFRPSETYAKAMEYTQSLLDKLSTGRTSYTDKVNSALAAIENRDNFQYDFNTDPLFQASLQGAMQSGQIAMQDTMGQAAALTGGYGSSYAQAVGNQAYNQAIQGAYNNIPEYYGAALDSYNAETNQLYNLLDMYSQQDQNEYNRLQNAYGLNAANAANIYDQEYNNYWQQQSMNQNAAEFSAKMAYQKARDEIADKQWKQEFEASAASAANKENASLDYSSANKNATASANKYGLDSDQYYDTLALLENQGYDISQIDNYARNNSDAASYSFDITQGRFSNQWGVTIDSEPIFTKIDNDTWEDQYHNQYTSSQKKAIEKAYKNATK